MRRGEEGDVESVTRGERGGMQCLRGAAYGALRSGRTVHDVWDGGRVPCATGRGRDDLSSYSRIVPCQHVCCQRRRFTYTPTGYYQERTGRQSGAAAAGCGVAVGVYTTLTMFCRNLGKSYWTSIAPRPILLTSPIPNPRRSPPHNTPTQREALTARGALRYVGEHSAPARGTSVTT
jgi:hypothetical protein